MFSNSPMRICDGFDKYLAAIGILGDLFKYFIEGRCTYSNNNYNFIRLATYDHLII